MTTLRRPSSLLALVLATATFAGGARAQETRLVALGADAKSKPKDAAASLAYGRALRRAAHWAEAKSELLRAVALATGAAKVDARWELARVELDQGLSNPSLPAPVQLPACKAIVIGKDGGALSHVCAAEAWLAFGRASIAGDELDKASQADPKLYELELGRAKLAAYDDKHADAIARLDALSKANGARADAFLWLGRELLATAKRADAVTPLKKARELDTDWPEAAYELSRALPDGTEARDAARLAVAMRPAWVDAQARLGELELQTGGLDAARAAFDAAIKLNGKHAGARTGLAWVLVKQKKFADAKAAALEAEKLAGNSPSARLAHAEAQAGLGEVDDAVETFKFAAGLDAKDPTGLVRAAEVLLAAKQPMKAEAHAEAAVKAFPGDGRAWRVKGDASLANGDKGSARDAYKKALAAPDGGIDKAALQKKLDALK